MNKLVILKIGEGSFDHGFSITLHIGDENQALFADRVAYFPMAEVLGRLPADPELPLCYRQWQSSYQRLGMRSRLDAPTVQVTNVSVIGDCQQAAQQLSDRLNLWLRHESFRPVREKWLELLQPSDPIRVIVQSDEPVLQRLPWHLWEVFQRYPYAELALSLPQYEHVRQAAPQPAIKILAILGSSEGIDIQADRLLLEQLPNAEVCFLPEPPRQTLSEQLWAQPWDILFFAGHSATAAAESAATGYICINATDRLTIEQLRYGLRQAVANGLKLAIFNSCDGLGLARSLADVQIPQMIIMREPVPDRVAQTFLNYFLEAFAGGKPLYLAVREAREKLQGLEGEFPCATWLPVICQNPAAVPPTWQSLCGVATPIDRHQHDRTPARRWTAGWQRFSRVCLTALSATALVTGIRYSGALQPLELAAYDRMLQLRPDEGVDRRMVIVTINEQEQQTYGQTVQLTSGQTTHISLSDRYLNQLLQKLAQHQPRVIGLDLYRDFPAANHTLTGLHNQSVIAVCKAWANDGKSISPPQNISPDRVGFSDFVEDDDRVVRRHLLFMTPTFQDPTSPCVAPYAFSVQIAFHYLAAHGILPTFTASGNLQLNPVIFKRLLVPTGGYQHSDTSGNQILLNYRSTHPALQVSISDVLGDRVNPNLINNQIILIGVYGNTALASHLADDLDIWHTPYGTTPGIVVQANMISQILSAVLDHRPLLWTWTAWHDISWMGAWALLGGILVCNIRERRRLAWAIGLSLCLLSGFCFAVLWVAGGWIPFVPTVLVFVITSAGVVVTARQPDRPLVPPPI